MVHDLEFPVIGSLLFPAFQVGCHHFRKEPLCLYERNLDVSVRVAVKRKLVGNIVWQRVERLRIGF